MELKPNALGTTGGGLSPSVVFQAHHKESDLNNGRKILINHSNTGVGGGGAQTGLAIPNCLIKDFFKLFY